MDLNQFLTEWHNDSDRLLVHTSGSTGQPKPLWVEKRRMEASARITCRFLGLKAGDSALLCMPLDYIAGKMMVVRALTCGLHLISIPPSGHPLSHPLPLEGDVGRLAGGRLLAAMVPMQVYNSLQVEEERRRLMSIDHLIIGGGAVDDRLAEALRTFPHAVWSTYGMTETLSHIALRRLNGPDASDWYTPFDSVSVSLADDGCLVIDAPLVCPQVLKSNDRAEVRDGRFRILGRLDNVVCSGGLKIQIEEVERQLRRHTATPFMMSKCRDERFGEALVLLVEGPTEEDMQALCRQVLPKYWQPRYYYAVDRLPLTATGKPARQEAECLVSRLRGQES